MFEPKRLALADSAAVGVRLVFKMNISGLTHALKETGFLAKQLEPQAAFSR